MHAVIANTDYDWYTFLRARAPLDEVNFWQPSGTSKQFHNDPPGTPFLFRLKSPYNAIAGIGFLARASHLPAWLAWESFGETNGASTFVQMVSRIEKYRRPARRDPSGSYEIGCLMIVEPVFFEPDAWVREPSGWKPNIVAGRREDITKGDGLRIYTECIERFQQYRRRAGHEAGIPETTEPTRRYGNGVLVKPRLGQGTFRIAVTDAYSRACAVSREHSLPVLEAAHIQPYAEGGSHSLQNGLLLRADIHKLFDKGYVTVSSDHRFEVSPRLKEDWDNGRSYYGYHGQPIHLPRATADQPGSGRLVWHNENKFLA